MTRGDLVSIRGRFMGASPNGDYCFVEVLTRNGVSTISIPREHCAVDGRCSCGWGVACDCKAEEPDVEEWCGCSPEYGNTYGGRHIFGVDACGLPVKR